MTIKQRLKFDSDNYKKSLESKRGHNYQYWSEKHNDLLENGWSLFEFTNESSRQWNFIFKRFSTSSEYHAKKHLEQLRADNNFARIICGYDKNPQKVKMYSIIYKPKNK